MGTSLINYPIAEWVKWNDLVSKIREEDFLSFQNESNQIFTKEIAEIIENFKKFFADFQFWFVSWFVEDNELNSKKSFDYWINILEKILISEKKLITQNSDFYVQITKIIAKQFSILGQEWFLENNLILKLLEQFINNLKSSEIEVLIEQVKEFSFLIKIDK